MHRKQGRVPFADLAMGVSLAWYHRKGSFQKKNDEERRPFNLGGKSICPQLFIYHVICIEKLTPALAIRKLLRRSSKTEQVIGPRVIKIESLFYHFASAFIYENSSYVSAPYTDENHTDTTQSVQRSTDLYRSTLYRQKSIDIRMLFTDTTHLVSNYS